mmetsp:Transcript_66858/g.131783  ORF Transcript_66858/g.131783 Transcript_66858/m.131783 type:complete len:80 (+) Transcript_66858:636-875(+)
MFSVGAEANHASQSINQDFPTGFGLEDDETFEARAGCQIGIFFQGPLEAYAELHATCAHNGVSITDDAHDDLHFRMRRS